MKKGCEGRWLLIRHGQTNTDSARSLKKKGKKSRNTFSTAKSIIFIETLAAVSAVFHHDCDHI